LQGCIIASMVMPAVSLREGPMRLLAGYIWPTGLAAMLATVLISSNVPAYAEPDRKVFDRAEAYKEPALRLLEALVNTDSGSGDDKGRSPAHTARWP